MTAYKVFICKKYRLKCELRQAGDSSGTAETGATYIIKRVSNNEVLSVISNR